jgi:hypothetical protein
MNRKSMIHLLHNAATRSSMPPKIKQCAYLAFAWMCVLLFSAIIAVAQAPQIPPIGSGQTAAIQRADSQIETDVVQAIGSSKSLKNEPITAATAGGEVTLFGTVSNESARELAEMLVSRISGVVRVDNRIKVAGEAQQQANMRPAPAVAENEQPPQQSEPAQPAMKDEVGENEQMADNTAPPPHVKLPPSDSEDVAEGAAKPTVQDPQTPSVAQSANEGQPQPVQQTQSGQPGRPLYQPGQSQPNLTPQQTAPQAYAPQPQTGPQTAGNYDAAQVTIPAGTLIQLRTSESLDTKHAKIGTMFEMMVLRDVYAGGRLAIPRGAKKSGNMGGTPVLALQLQSLDLGSQSYTLVSDTFNVRGPNKAGYTASNIIVSAGLGALIGAAIGHGPGAAIGAVVGAGTGTAVSAATPGTHAWIPAEALVTFHLAQPVTVSPVSPEEARRLARGLFQGAPGLYRRGPGFYAAGPYPYPAPQPFYHPYYVTSGYYYWR